jgi:hypothetical protein
MKLKAPIRGLAALAWVIFGADALVALVWLGAGAVATNSLERDMTVLPALIATAALAGLFGIIYFSARRGSLIGLCIGVVMAAAPLYLLVEMIGEQHGLWPRM